MIYHAPSPQWACVRWRPAVGGNKSPSVAHNNGFLTDEIGNEADSELAGGIGYVCYALLPL